MITANLHQIADAVAGKGASGSVWLSMSDPRFNSLSVFLDNEDQVNLIIGALEGCRAHLREAGRG